MSLRRSYLSRRIIHRSFTLSNSHKASKSPEIQSICGENECDDNGSERRGGLELPAESVSWAGMPPELLGEIIQRVEVSDEKWPQRRNVVAFGCVCKRWRTAAREAVEKASFRQPGIITFPCSLKKPGPRDSPIQCLIKRDKKKATFYLYLALTPSFMDKGKFLLAARKYRNGAQTEYIISLDADDLSQGSKAYVGKLRSDFLGTNFTIYDCQPPHVGAKPSSSNRSGRRVASRQISPQVPSSNFEVGQVSYKFNLLKSRGPRRMLCSLIAPPFPNETSAADKNPDSSKKAKKVESSSGRGCTTVLKNKAPRWHEHLECWCLNFHGRVTVASVKNFQLAATMVDLSDDETVVLQFGKVGDDTFTMDFRRPISAFQAFAICLTSFGTKLACE